MPVGEWSMYGIKSKHPKPFWWGQPHHINHSTKSPSHQVIKSPSKHQNYFADPTIAIQQSHRHFSRWGSSSDGHLYDFVKRSIPIKNHQLFWPKAWDLWPALTCYFYPNPWIFGQVWLIALELWIRWTPLWLCQKIRRRKKCAQDGFKTFWAFCQYGTFLEIEANKSLKVFCL